MSPTTFSVVHWDKLFFYVLGSLVMAKHLRTGEMTLFQVAPSQAVRLPR